jgi:bifunctional DNA-binding transcriptional regulator/antitoxin component of YhaV-PrlF toxin-antitoxin module
LTVDHRTRRASAEDVNRQSPRRLSRRTTIEQRRVGTVVRGLRGCFTISYDSKGMSKLSSKHQVTIPVRILREAGLAAGDEVVILANGRGRIEIARADDLVRRYAGSLPAGTYADGYLDELRSEWRE